MNEKGKNKKIVKVAIGVPSNDMIHTDFAMSLINLTLITFMGGIAPIIISQKSSIIEVGRNELVQTAFKCNADYLLMLDSDMIFPSVLLKELLSHDKDIICCDAVQRRAPFNQVVKTLDNKAINYNTCKDRLVELMGVSTATMLVKMDVFKKIKGPWFIVEWKGNNNFLGEDYYFSNLARENGYKVWCDVELSKKIGHIGAKAFYIPNNNINLTKGGKK